MKAIVLAVLLFPLVASADDPAQRFTTAYVNLLRQASDGLQKVAALVDPANCSSVDKALPVATTELKEHEKLLQQHKSVEKGLTPEQIKAGTHAAMQQIIPEMQQKQGGVQAASERLKSFKKACPAQAQQAETQLKPLMQPMPMGG